MNTSSDEEDYSYQKFVISTAEKLTPHIKDIKSEEALAIIYYFLLKNKTIDVPEKFIKELSYDLGFIIRPGLQFQIKNMDVLKGMYINYQKLHNFINGYSFYEFAKLFKSHINSFDNVQKYVFVIDAYHAVQNNSWDEFKTKHKINLNLSGYKIHKPKKYFNFIKIIDMKIAFERFKKECERYFKKGNANYEQLWQYFQNPEDWETYTKEKHYKLNPQRMVISFDRTYFSKKELAYIHNEIESEKNEFYLLSN